MLGAVQQPVVAVPGGARFHGGRIRAGLGLGQCKGPGHFGAQDRLQIALALFALAGQQRFGRLADHVSHGLGYMAKLFAQQNLSQPGQAGAAGLDWQVVAEQAHFE